MGDGELALGARARGACALELGCEVVGVGAEARLERPKLGTQLVGVGRRAGGRFGWPVRKVRRLVSLEALESYTSEYWSAADRDTVLDTLPFRRTAGSEPGHVNGYWDSGKSYASGGVGAVRSVWRPT